jgi:hypothetical protein
MTNIIPFNSTSLPAYLKNVNKADLNSDLLAHASGGFPIISIKGKTFSIRRDGERRMMMNPKDPESAATSIEVVMVRVNKGVSKVFYAKGYTDGEDAKPDCFSNDGKAPDASSTKPQAKTCQVCPKNQWGSKISENGGKLKACSDSIRMAVAAPDQINDPMLLRVPAASMKAVGEYGAMLAKRGVPSAGVVTKVSFDPEAATPKLVFKAVGLLPDAAKNEVDQMYNDPTVENIIAGGATFNESDGPVFAAEPAAPARVAAKTVTASEVEEAVDSAAAEMAEAAATPVTKTKPKAKAAAVEVEISLDDLSDLNFDD